MLSVVTIYSINPFNQFIKNKFKKFFQKIFFWLNLILKLHNIQFLPLDWLSYFVNFLGSSRNRFLTVHFSSAFLCIFFRLRRKHVLSFDIRWHFFKMILLSVGIFWFQCQFHSNLLENISASFRREERLFSTFLAALPEEPPVIKGCDPFNVQLQRI